MSCETMKPFMRIRGELIRLRPRCRIGHHRQVFLADSRAELAERFAVQPIGFEGGEDSDHLVYDDVIGNHILVDVGRVDCPASRRQRRACT